MIIESIIIAIFIGSFGGALIIIARKAPALSTMPKNGTTGIEKYKFFSDAESKTKEFFAIFTDGILLHKFLSWSKCRTIKMETWIDGMLHGLRKKAKENKLNKKK
ncbi:MAG: hypothetical protein Q8Q48_02250 [Candidatus Staskawiczbacteria bacterium]|nr:hypothetical protein [Candidatus Staskawiczbacteria bacterium]